MTEEDLLKIIDKLKKILEENGGVIKFKNYPTMCRTLGLEIKRGSSSKNAQLNELKTICDLTQDNKSFAITQVYDEPLTKVDGRSEKMEVLSMLTRKAIESSVNTTYILKSKENKEIKFSIKSIAQLNKEYLNYDIKIVENCIKEMVDNRYKDLDKEFVKSLVYSVEQKIENRLWLNGWITNMNRLNDKNIGYDNEVGIRIVVGEDNPDEDEKAKFYCFTKDSCIQKLWREHNKKYAEENNIKVCKYWEETSMRHATKSQKADCTRKFIENNKELLLNTEDLFGKVLTEEELRQITKIQTVLILYNDKPQTLKRITTEEINELSRNVFDDILDKTIEGIIKREKEIEEELKPSKRAIGRIKKNDDKIKELKLKGKIKTEFLDLVIEQTFRKPHNKFI